MKPIVWFVFTATALVTAVTSQELSCSVPPPGSGCRTTWELLVELGKFSTTLEYAATPDVDLKSVLADPNTLVTFFAARDQFYESTGLSPGNTTTPAVAYDVGEVYARFTFMQMSLGGNYTVGDLIAAGTGITTVLGQTYSGNNFGRDLTVNTFNSGGSTQITIQSGSSITVHGNGPPRNLRFVANYSLVDVVEACSACNGQLYVVDGYWNSTLEVQDNTTTVPLRETQPNVPLRQHPVLTYQPDCSNLTIAQLTEVLASWVHPAQQPLYDYLSFFLPEDNSLTLEGMSFTMLLPDPHANQTLTLPGPDFNDSYRVAYFLNHIIAGAYCGPEELLYSGDTLGQNLLSEASLSPKYSLVFGSVSDADPSQLGVSSELWSSSALDITYVPLQSGIYTACTSVFYFMQADSGLPMAPLSAQGYSNLPQPSKVWETIKKLTATKKRTPGTCAFYDTHTKLAYETLPKELRGTVDTSPRSPAPPPSPLLPPPPSPATPPASGQSAGSGSPANQSSSGSSFPIVLVAIPVVVLGLVVIVALFVLYRYRRRKLMLSAALGQSMGVPGPRGGCPVGGMALVLQGSVGSVDGKGVAAEGDEASVTLSAQDGKSGKNAGTTEGSMTVSSESSKAGVDSKTLGSSNTNDTTGTAADQEDVNITSIHKMLSSANHNWLIEAGQLTEVKKVGSGSFGDVFLGLWNGTQVAIKKLPGKGEGDAEYANLVDGLRKEIAIMAGLRHPNVMLFMGVTIDPPCIVTEFCDRGSLYGVLSAAASNRGALGQMEWRRRVQMALDAALGMEFLHARNVVHCDLKSPNLLVDRSWGVKVGDFGLSKFLDPSKSRTSIVALNPTWLAPEVIEQQQHSRAADVYSFAIIMWELMTLQKPFEDMPPYQIGYAVVNKQLRPDVPEHLSTLLGGTFDGIDDYISLMKACWSQDAAQRPAFQQVVSGLKKLRKAFVTQKR